MNNVYVKTLVVLMFIVSGLYKLYDPLPSVVRLSKKATYLPKNLVPVIIFLAGLWELVAGLMVYSRHRSTRILGLYMLVVFTILATLIFYFPPTGMKYYPFISNITTIGGLLSLV